MELNGCVVKRLPVYKVACTKMFKHRNIAKIDRFVCTKNGRKISTSMVRNAMSRIFSDPHQSIMEPIVNGFDSYELGGSIGKFGMGFFSFLYWLIGHPERWIQVVSVTNKTTYTEMKIRECKDGDLVVDVIVDVLKVPEHNGTSIKLMFATRQKPDVYRKFITYITKLQLYPHSPLRVKTYVYNPILRSYPKMRIGNKKFYCINGKFYPDLLTSTKYGVSVIFDRIFIQIEDMGNGIKPDVLFNSLLVPSSSSKTIKLNSKISNYKVKPRIYTDSTSSSLIITVANIQIISVNMKKGSRIYVVDMPPYTPVPVARNDIIIDSMQIQDILEYNLYTLFIQSLIHFNDINDIQVLWKSVISKSTSSYNSKIYTTIYNNVINKINLYIKENNFIAIRDTQTAIKSLIVKLPIIVNYYTALEGDFQKGETDLITILESNKYIIDRKLFFGKTVIYINNVNFKYSSLNTMSIFFISKNMLVSGSLPKITLNKIITSTVSDNLIQYGSDIIVQSGTRDFNSYFKSNDYKDIYALISRYKFTYSKTLWNVLFNYYNRLEALSERWYIFNLDSFMKLTLGFVEIFKFDEDYVIKMLKISYNYMSKYNKYADQDDYTFDTKTLYFNNPKENISKWFYRRMYLILKSTNDDLTTYKWHALLTKLPSWKLKKFMNINLQVFIYMSDLHLNRADRNIAIMLPTLMTYIFISSHDNDIPILFEDRFETYMHASNARELLIVESVWNPYKYIHHPISRLNLNTIIPKYIDIIKREYSNITIDETIETHLLTLNSSNNLYFSHREFSSLYILMHTLLTLTNVYIAPDVNHEKVKGQQYNVKLSNIVEYAFKSNKEEHIKDLIKNVQKLYENKSSNNPIQIVEIAINEGGTKDILLSVLTELIQNSIDAIKGLNPKREDRRDILIYLGRNKGNSITMSVVDNVGIDQKYILPLSIPYFSSKTPSPNNTGEMGNGFFNVYRKSSKVIISTSVDGNGIQIVDTPVLDSNNRVIDLDKSITFYTNSIIGTEVRVEFVPMTITEYEYNISIVTDYINNVLNSIDNKIASIKFQGKRINSNNPELIYSTPNASLFSVKGSSYVFTNGVPFTDMVTFLNKNVNIERKYIDIIRSGFIIDIPYGKYTPVQSRDSLHLNPQVLKDIRKMYYHMNYYTGINNITIGFDDPRNSFIYMNYTDMISNQLTFKRENYTYSKLKPNYKFIVKYSPLPHGKIKFKYGLYNTIADVISDHYVQIYKIVIANLHTYLRTPSHITAKQYIVSLLIAYINKHISYTSKKSKYITNIHNKITEIIIDRFVFSFRNIFNHDQLIRYNTIPLLTKIHTGDDVTGNRSKTLVVKSYQKVTEGIETLEYLLNSFVKTYWRIGRKINILKGPSPTVVIDFEGSCMGDAEYVSSKNQIVIKQLPVYQNGNRIQLESVYKLLELINSKDADITTHKLYKLLFSWKIVPHAIIHELEHARNRTSHKVSVHDDVPVFYSLQQARDISDVIPSAKGVKQIPFNTAAAICHYLIYIEDDFIPTFITNIVQTFQSNLK